MRVRLLALLAGCALVTGCSGSDESPATPTDAPSPSSGGDTPGPLMGASQALLPAPGDDGVLLVTGPPEGLRDTGPLHLWRWDGATWTEVEASGPAPQARSFFAAAHDPVRDVERRAEPVVGR